MEKTNITPVVSNPNEIFGKIKKSDFKELLTIANKYRQLPIEELYQSYVNDNKKLELMSKEWEQSVLKGSPNFSVYRDDYYINEVFICWKEYSRKYLLILQKYLDREDCKINKNEIKSILDLGCGCGYSTIGLKSLFPNAIVSATNLKGTLQYDIDKHVTNNIDGCYIYDENDAFDLGNVDVVFASEFFEHLIEPIDYLVKLIDIYRPKYFIFANTFTRMAIGHFNSYRYNGCEYIGGQISRKFNNTLRENGYVKVDTGFFNNRPQVFKLANNK